MAGAATERMPDYIYLLENRLSPAQQGALRQVREAARDAGFTVFLTGGAVRDLTSGSPVRDLDVSIQGNALNLKKRLTTGGAVLWGENEKSQTLFFRFPHGVRVEISSTRREEFSRPGVPVYHPASILEDLRRRDFTANAMALSLNEGSYGLLMDPLNGVADLEARSLRLVSNYGFLEDPIRLVRAARLSARLGWELEERTRARFENASEEGVIQHISAYARGYEVEEIAHEEDGLKILKALEADGWMKHLYAAWTSTKADVESLEEMREVLVQLQMQGVNPDSSAAQAELLTAKMSPKDLAGLKKMFVRPGFVREWESLEARAKDFSKQLTGKEASTASATWRLFTSGDPEAILWLGLTSKSAAVQDKYKNFFSVWPEARQRIPYVLMQEMRITPELEGYQDLLRGIFLELIDEKLTTDEEMRAFLEPHSPPAPPPPVSIRRTRAKKQAGPKIKEIEDEDAHERDEDQDLDEEGSGEKGERDSERDHDHEEPAINAVRREPKPVVQEILVREKESPRRVAAVQPTPKPAVKEPPAARLEAKPATAKELAKPVTPKPAEKAVVKSVVTKPVPAKAVKKPAVKIPSKPLAKTKPAAKPRVPEKLKDAAKKKAAVSAPVKGKLRQTVAKPKPLAKVKAAAKSLPAKKKTASAKAVLARRKR